MAWAWHGHGMASVNQTRPHCVNQMGKTHYSKTLAARHGRGTAWMRHGNGMLFVNRPLLYSFYNLDPMPSTCRFTRRERPDTHCIGGWIGLRARLDGCRKSRPNGIRSPERPACSESLYRLSYPGPLFVSVINEFCSYNSG